MKTSSAMTIIALILVPATSLVFMLEAIESRGGGFAGAAWFVAGFGFLYSVVAAGCIRDLQREERAHALRDAPDDVQ